MEYPLSKIYGREILVEQSKMLHFWAADIGVGALGGKLLGGSENNVTAAEATGDYYSVAYQTELKASSYPEFLVERTSKKRMKIFFCHGERPSICPNDE